MFTNRSKDHPSLCSFTFADGRQAPHSPPGQASVPLRLPCPQVVVAGLQTRQRHGREPSCVL